MLAYVVEAYERGASDDVVFIPVSIAYDQIQDVRAHVAEASGKGKQNEGARWLFRQLSKDLTDSYGKIYVRFGAPIRLGEFLTTVGESEDADDPRSTVVPKLAFEVSTRINEVTPITPISLVTMVLLGQGGSAMTFADIQSALQPIAEFIDRRSLPTTEPIHFDSEDQIRASLNQLITHKVVEEFPGVDEPIFSIAHEQHLAASYYRNTIIHFFVTTAITELAILNVRDDPNAAHSVFDKALELRDLLKFEFFFPATDAFLGDVRHELLRHNDEWRSLLVAGDIDTLLSSFEPALAPLALRPFIESYRVVAEVIERNAYVSTLDEKTIKKDAMSLGGQYLRQGDIVGPESVSNPLFDTAIALTKYLGLLDPCATSIDDRQTHAARLRTLVDQLAQLANR
ncbi:glycerol-3-phosphate acyltransferase [bacterium BMS3Bbin02]|nr:glycerol-3-phosphate acyltransferase [bacterium BMS3Bbin02]